VYEHRIVFSCAPATPPHVRLPCRCRAKKQYCGTTALGAIVRGSQLVVFNIGDCHAVLCANGVAADMSEAHKPNRPDEGANHDACLCP